MTWSLWIILLLFALNLTAPHLGMILDLSSLHAHASYPFAIHTGTENHFSTHPKHVDIGAGASACSYIVLDVHTNGSVLVINQIILGSFCDRFATR